MPKDRDEVNVFMLTVLLIGLFIGMGVNFWLGMKTFVHVDTLFHVVIIGGMAAAGIYFLFFRYLERYLAEVIAYSIIGWGNILLAILLSLNFFFHEKPVTTVYGLEENIVMMVNSATEIEISDELYKDYPYMLKFDEHEINGKNTGAQIIVNKAYMTTAEGLFGYKILLNKELR